jgi:GAF domain-containing protein
VLIGGHQAGNAGLEDFTTFQVPINESPYARHVLESYETAFFHGRELGAKKLDSFFAEHGFKPPVGDWAYIPLWTGKRCWGTLALDNASKPRPLRPEQRKLLRLFGRQVAAAMERAILYGQVIRKTRELALLNQVGEGVIALTAAGDLDTLLHRVRDLINPLVTAHNCMVVLLDEETQRLNYRLWFENDRQKTPKWGEPSEGLIAHVITTDQPLFLPDGTAEYRKAHGIKLMGRAAKSWMGMPLRVEGRAIGALVIEDNEQAGAYKEEDWEIFQAVAGQVSGAIRTAYLKDRQEEISRQLEILHRASATIMTLAEQQEDWLWHATLTVATAGYALRFNRATLFLLEQGGTHLRGRMGIGHFEKREALRNWQRDDRSELQFDDYLTRLQAGQIEPTPVEQVVRALTIDLRDDQGILAEVVHSGQLALLPAVEAAHQLPAAFTKPFGITDYAILPLRAGNKVIGVVIVDNVHTRSPLRTTTLTYLEPLLTQAALIWENLHQRSAKDQLIELNYTVMAELSTRPLKDILDQVCQAAQVITRADRVLIFPLVPGADPFVFDGENIGRSGETAGLARARVPRQNGVSAHILRAGTLAVPQVADHYIEQTRLADHPSLLHHERIQAFIGAPLRDAATGEIYGVLYLDYRTPQTFTLQDTRQAEAFASLAAVAIRNIRTAQAMRAETVAAEAQTQARERELNLLRQVFEEALAADTDHSKVIRTLLKTARDMLNLPDVRIGLLLRDWEVPDQTAQESHEVRRQHFMGADGRLSTSCEYNIYYGISGLALRTGETQLVGDVSQGERSTYFYNDKNFLARSEMDVPIKFEKHVIGVFNIESPSVNTFTEGHRAIIERLAAGAALALDNVRRQEHLHTVLDAIRAVTAPLGLKATLDAIVDVGRRVALDLSALTIWYREPQDGCVKLGAYFGVWDKVAIRDEKPSQGGAVTEVMESQVPIWAMDVQAEPRLSRGFIRTEAIKSVAAFPLWADDEIVGAMFFNYRHTHEFTREERSLFSLLAEIAAASVRDAMRLEETRKERKRFKAALEVTEAIGTTLEFDPTLHKIMKKLRELFPQANPCVMIYDQVERILTFTSHRTEFYPIDNPDYQNLTQVHLDAQSIASDLARRSLQSRQVEVINIGDTTDHPAYLKLISSTRSELCVTLMSGEQLLGVLVLESPELAAFDEDSVALMRSIGQQVSIALDRAYQTARLQFQTTAAGMIGWAAEVAHDINREVSVIRNRIYWLTEEPGLSDDGRQYVQEIDASATRLAGTLPGMSLQHLSRPETFHVDLCLARWSQEIVKKRGSPIALDFRPGCQDLHIHSYPEAVRRVLRHLLNNALDVLPENASVQIQTRILEEEWVEIMVADNGPGVPVHIRPLLFQQPVTTRQKGGLGLIIVRLIVEQLRGTVRLVSSEAGKGAVFAFRLPIE